MTESGEPGWARPWLGLAGLGALVWACASLEKHSFSVPVQAALALGLAIWLVLAWTKESRETLPPLDPASGPPRFFWLAASLAAASLAFWMMPSDEFRPIPTLLWLAAVAIWVVAWRRRASASLPAAPVARPGAAEWAALAAVLAVGAFFCFWRINSVPPNPVSDHAEEMLDMLDLINGRHAIYYMRNLGREPFHFYWTSAFVFAGLPLHFLTLKIATAVVGLAGVIALYGAGRELGGPTLGLCAAGLLAWAKWNFSLARQGLDYTHAVVPTTILIWALARWQRRGDRISLLIAGAAVGIGLAGYTSFRVVPLLVPLAMAVALADRRRKGRRWAVVGAGLLATATAVLVCLPLLKFIFFGATRSYFWARTATRATGAERALNASPLSLFAGNLWNMARAFHWRGSSTWTVMLEDDPFVDLVTGGLLFAGVALLLARLVRGSWRWSWLAPALFILTLPSTLSLAYPNENPSLNRAGPAIPVVFLIAGLSLAWMVRGFLRERAVFRAAGLAALGLLMAWSIQRNYRVYFGDFADSYDHMIDHSMEMAQALRQVHARGIPYSQCYLLGMDFWVDGRNIAFQIDDPGWADTNLVAQGKLPSDLSKRPLAFLYHPSDTARLRKLEELGPGSGGILRQKYSDRDFGLYIVR